MPVQTTIRSAARTALFTLFSALAVLVWQPVTALAQPLRDPGPAEATVTEPGYLGLLTDDRQESGKGVRVMEAIADSPALKAGLQTGDLIVGINDKAVRTTADLAAVLQTVPPGGTVAFEVDRNGQTQKFTVTLGKRPPLGQRRFESFGPQGEKLPSPGGSSTPPPPAPSLSAARRPVLGVRTQPLTAEMRRRLRLTTEGGALVAARTSGSPAEKAGIPIDAVITAFNGAPVNSPQDLLRLVSDVGPGRDVQVSYEFEGKNYRVTVQLSEASESAATPIPGPGGAPAPAIPDTRSAERAALPDDASRIDALERRVESLERRVQQLERR